MPAGKGRYTVGGKGTYGCSGYPVVGGEGKVHGCHETAAAAQAQQAAIYASEARASKMDCCPDQDIWLGSAFSKRDYSTRERRRLAESGAAMPDGSFPIVTGADLRNAIQSVGRASNYEAARRHIIRRARALGMTDMLPEDWK